MIGREVPLRALEAALACAAARGAGLRRGGDRQDAARRRARGRGADGLARAARRVRRVRRRGAGLCAGRRGAARPPRGLAGGVPRRAVRRGARRAGRRASARGARRRRAGRALYELLLDLLGRLPPSAPVLLVLEDIHWADRSTLDAARVPRAQPARASGSSCSPPTASTTSSRPRCAASRASCAAGGPCCGSSSSRWRATTSPASSRRSRAGRCRAALVDELHARAGGNPFFVEALFAAGADDG